jgi:hypothetical protein
MDARNPAAEGEFHATPVVSVIDALWFISQKAMLGPSSSTMFFFVQTAQTSICHSFQRPSQPIGEPHYESGNDFDYRRACFFVWWRRLVLARARARLTRRVSGM